MNNILKTDKDYIAMMDTDSAVLLLEDLINKLIPGETDKIKKVNIIDQFAKTKIQPYLNDCFLKLKDILNDYEHKLDMKREKICERGIWTTKKRYVVSVWDKEGVRYDKPQIAVTGLESARSSTPEVCRKALSKAYEIMLTSTKEEVIKYMNDFEEEYKKMNPEDIASPRTSNNVDKFSKGVIEDDIDADEMVFNKGTPIHIRANIIYNKLIKEKNVENLYYKINDAEKAKFVYLKVPNPVHENVIGFINVLPKEFGLHKYVDYDTQFEKTFLKPLEAPFKALNWKYREQANLEDLFQ